MRDIKTKTIPLEIFDTVDVLAGKLSASQEKLNQTLASMRYTPSIFVALLYVTFVVTMCHYQNVFEFDNDEGNNLIKALLVDRGFSLYSEVWNDQPPFFTYLLRFFFSIFGWHTNVARAVVLGFSGIAVFVVSDMLLMSMRAQGNKAAGMLAAAAGCAFLVNSEVYVQLSVCVMIGLPSISFMMLAIWAIVQAHHSSGRVIWPVLAGVFTALSLGTKLFTGFMAPLCVIGLAVSGWAKYRAEGRLAPLIPALSFLTGFALVTLAVFLPSFGKESIDCLVESHRAIRFEKDGDANGLKMLTGFFEKNTVLFSLATLGAVRTVITRNLWTTPWVFWLIAAIFVLYDHHPVWFHHQLLLTVPGAVLAGYATGEMLNVPWPRRMPPWLIPVLWCVAMALIAGFVHKEAHSQESKFHVSKSQQTAQTEIMNAIAKYRDDVKYMVASRPHYAFKALKPVLPDLAITSIKRFNGGNLSATYILREIKEHKVDMVVVSSRWRRNIRNKIRRELQPDYRQVFRTGYNDTDIWLRKDLKSRKDATLQSTHLSKEYR